MATTGPWKIEYPLRKFKKPLAVATTRQGTMANAIIRQINWPRMILMYFGRRHVTSAANGMMLQAIDVPSVAKAKAMEVKKTPARALEV